MVKLTANGQTFEGLDQQAIKYTKQISDIFDLAVVSSSYTNGFKIPKTPHNTQIMQGLGIIGDTSQIPYQKVPSTLSQNGFTLFSNGWLSVKETTEEYNVSCIDGMIDFFKAIENKTMGTDLNLSNFNHEKDLPTVIASFTNEYYKYIVADYNGKNLGTFEDTEGINIDYLVPCFNLRKLFDLVMTTFGYGYDETNIEEIDELWITYPKNPADVVADDLAADLTLNPFNTTTVVSVGGGYYSAPASFKSWSTSTINEGALISNWRYEVGEASVYRIDVTAEMYALYRWVFNYNKKKYTPMLLTVKVNGAEVISLNTDPYAEVAASTTQYLNTGDIVELDFKVTPYEIQIYRLREIHANGVNMVINKTNQGNVNLSDAFKDFQIKDFIKEIFWRTAVTPVINNLNNTMSFVSLDERLDFSNAVDWSNKYIKRTKENYTQGNYAQKNVFAHKYNDEDDVSQNGYLNINNQNLPDEITLVQSKIYAPELIRYFFTDQIVTDKFTVWQRESKEDTDGNLSIDYKGLNGRFYIMKYITSPAGSYNFVSEAAPDLETVTSFPYANTQGTTFDQIVPIKYGAYSGVLNNFRAHDIQLALSLNDVLGLDLTRPYYIKKEGMYYILNRIVFSEGSILTGEFIRINKVV